MAHSAPRRGSTTCDEANAWLLPPALCLIAQKLCSVFFGRTANLADHNQRLGFLVTEEHFEDVDEFSAFDRIAADADTSRLSEAFSGGLENRFICKRAGPRNNANFATLMNVARHDADLALTRRDDSRTIGTYEA